MTRDPARWQSCLHEAGHATVMSAFGLRLVEVRAGEPGGSWARCEPPADTPPVSRSVAILVAGSLADGRSIEFDELAEVWTPGESLSDIEKLRNARVLGMTAGQFSDGVFMARAVLAERAAEVDALAAELYDSGVAGHRSAGAALSKAGVPSAARPSVTRPPADRVMRAVRDFNDPTGELAARRASWEESEGPWDD